MASNVTPREALVTVAARVLSDWNYKAALLAKGRPHADDVKAQKTADENFGKGHKYVRDPMEVDTALEHVAATWGTSSGARQWITWGVPGEAERLTSAACQYFSRVSSLGYARLANEVEAKAAERVRALLAAEQRAHYAKVLARLTQNLFHLVREREPDAISDGFNPQWDRYLWSLDLYPHAYLEILEAWLKANGHVNDKGEPEWTSPASPMMAGQFDDLWIKDCGVVTWACIRQHRAEGATVDVIVYAYYLEQEGCNNE